ncbi:hypothetical protein ACFWM5_31275 [Streptomyces bobili]
MFLDEKVSHADIHPDDVILLDGQSEQAGPGVYQSYGFLRTDR